MVDFTLGTPSGSLSVTPGGSQSTTLTLTPQGSYSGTVNLTLTSVQDAATGTVLANSGITVSFGSSLVTAGSPSSPLTILVSPTTAPGDYVLTITGTDTQNPALSHTTTITVHVVQTIVTVSGQKPQDVYVTIPASGTANASVVPDRPGVTKVCDWSTVSIYYAAPTKKGQPEVFAPATDGSTVAWNGNSADETYTATFNSVGRYILEASCMVSLEDSAGNVLWSGSGTGYIGGTQADVLGDTGSSGGNPTANGTPNPNADIAHLEPDAAGGTSGTPGRPGIPVKPLLRIKCNGNFITNNLKPFRVIRGKKVTLTVIAAPSLTITSGSWTISPAGSPVKSFSWTRPYSGMIAAIQTTPLPQVLTGQSISFYFTSPAKNMVVSYAGIDANGHSHSAQGQVTAYDLKPTAPDTIVTFQPYFIHYGRWGKQYKIPMKKLLIVAIPPTQIIYPFTPAPNVVNNANSADGQGINIHETPKHHPFWSDYCAGGSIGDWGKATPYWPDLNYPQPYNPYPGVSTPRRMGGNFNFGAMAANSMPLWIALKAAKYLNPLHPEIEQQAIEAGYAWWSLNPRPPLSNGATISIHLSRHDTDFHL